MRSLHQPIERLLDHGLVLRIDRGERFVEDQDRRVAQNRARDREALALPAGQARAALADHRLVTVGQRLDELVRVCGARGRFDFLHVASGRPRRRLSSIVP